MKIQKSLTEYPIGDHSLLAELPDFCSDCVALREGIRQGIDTLEKIMSFFSAQVGNPFNDPSFLLTHLVELREQKKINFDANLPASLVKFEFIEDPSADSPENDHEAMSVVQREKMIVALFERLENLDIRYRDIIQPYYREKESVLKQIADLAGIGPDRMRQTKSGLVWQIYEPESKIVFFDKLAYKRTPRPDEPTQGHMSLKSAIEKGFKLPDRTYKKDGDK
jgi:hypothetical protein